MALVKACLLVLACASAAMAQGDTSLGRSYTGSLSEPLYTLNTNLTNTVLVQNNDADRRKINDFIRLNESLSEEIHFEWQGYDGWFNNPAHPDWGGAGKLHIILSVESTAFWSLILICCLLIGTL